MAMPTFEGCVSVTKNAAPQTTLASTSAATKYTLATIASADSGTTMGIHRVISDSDCSLPCSIAGSLAQAHGRPISEQLRLKRATQPCRNRAPLASNHVAGAVLSSPAVDRLPACRMRELLGHPRRGARARAADARLPYRGHLRGLAARGLVDDVRRSEAGRAHAAGARGQPEPARRRSARARRARTRRCRERLAVPEARPRCERDSPAH